MDLNVPAVPTLPRSLPLPRLPAPLLPSPPPLDQALAAQLVRELHCAADAFNHLAATLPRPEDVYWVGQSAVAFSDFVTTLAVTLNQFGQQCDAAAVHLGVVAVR